MLLTSLSEKTTSINRRRRRSFLPRASPFLLSTSHTKKNRSRRRRQLWHLWPGRRRRPRGRSRRTCLLMKLHLKSRKRSSLCFSCSVTHSGLWWLGFSFSHPQRRSSVCGLPLPVVRMRAIRIVSRVTCPYLDLINVTELLSSCKSLKDLLNDNLGRRPFDMNLILLAIMTLLIAGSLSFSLSAVHTPQRDHYLLSSSSPPPPPPPPQRRHT